MRRHRRPTNDVLRANRNSRTVSVQTTGHSRTGCSWRERRTRRLSGGGTASHGHGCAHMKVLMMTMLMRLRSGDVVPPWPANGMRRSRCGRRVHSDPFAPFSRIGQARARATREEMLGTFGIVAVRHRRLRLGGNCRNRCPTCRHSQKAGGREQKPTQPKMVKHLRCVLGTRNASSGGPPRICS